MNFKTFETGVPHLKNPTQSVGNAGPLNTKYLYYPRHVETATLQGSLLPACIGQNK